MQVDDALDHDDGVSVLGPQDDRVVVRARRYIQLGSLEGERRLTELWAENPGLVIHDHIGRVVQVVVVLPCLHDEPQLAVGQVERGAVGIEEHAAEAVGLPAFKIELQLLLRSVRQPCHLSVSIYPEAVGAEQHLSNAIRAQIDSVRPWDSTLIRREKRSHGAHHIV